MVYLCCLPHIGNFPQHCALVSCSLIVVLKNRIQYPRGGAISSIPISHESTILPLAPIASMSHTHTTATQSSYFQSILSDATGEYERRQSRHTRKGLLAHPLAAQLELCNSPSCIIFLIKQLAQELSLSQRVDDRRSLALAQYTPGYAPVPSSGRPSVKEIFISAGVDVLHLLPFLYPLYILPITLYSVCIFPMVLPSRRPF